MRTTLILDDSLMEKIQLLAHKTGKPLKQIVNETLAIGLQHQNSVASKPYRLKTVQLGQPHSSIDLSKALQLSDALEDEALVEKWKTGS